jgi:energy-coupling factor transport system substrate-specific component
MDNKLLKVAVTLLAVLAIFALVSWYVQRTISPDFQMSNVTTRFIFVIIGLLIAFAIYYFTRENKMWEVGTREVVYMAIGAALYAILSYLFNGTVFFVPSVSQVSLRPAIVIPMFFGYTFGPVVGFFTGAVGNMFGDALTGFGLSPQWSVGNGLVGMIAGLVMLFKDRKRSIDTILWVSGVLAALTVALFLLNRNTENKLFFDVNNNIFGDAPISLFAGISIVVGFVLVLVVRFLFANNVDITAAVTWGMLGNLLGLGFAALSDIWVNGYSPVVAIVGEFLPAAGPNLLFAAILVPILVVAYLAVGRQTGR